ncbi:hypothetical protein V6N13_049019 [Hibiscus sabdariffa]|uniref:PRONE domain-containing protein n=1 Tax=Hibiscus sabdariffa TaxID=183260 RepID=A0ABR2QZ56_9ROSI
MLVTILDGFHNSEFYHVNCGLVINDTDGIEAFPSSSPSWRLSARLEEKWWLPFPKVPPSGLSEDCSSVGMEHIVHYDFCFLLAFHRGKDCLGEVMYLDLSSECTAPEMANWVGDSVHIWKHKYLKRHSLRAKVGKSA